MSAFTDNSSSKCLKFKVPKIKECAFSAVIFSKKPEQSDSLTLGTLAHFRHSQLFPKEDHFYG
jgi:hypothetical protein